MFVCSNRTIAFHLYKKIAALRPEWVKIPGERERQDDGWLVAADSYVPYGNRELPIEKMKLIMTRSKDDNLELYNLLGTDDDRRAWAETFKKPESNFKMWTVWTRCTLINPCNSTHLYRPFRV